MYNALKNKFLEKDSANKNVLAISRSSSFGRLLGLRAAIYTEADYPEYNMLSLKFPDNSFDFCVSDQVLEHVEGNPYAAFHETARVIRPGGWICHTTCFINPIHAVPKDFWRFTPDALRLLAESSGCTEIEVGG